MKKLIALVIVAVMLLSMMPMVTLAASTPTTIYMRVGVWGDANAKFEAWCWGSSTAGDAWKTFTRMEDGNYSMDNSEGYTSMKILRRGPNMTNGSWDNNQKWNDSGDQRIPTDGKNCFVVNGWDNYSWGTYTPPAAPSEYYLHGWINNGDFTENTYKFVNGKVTVTLSADSYVYVGTDVGINYKTAAYVGSGNTATLLTSGVDKLFVPVGTFIFTLTDNGDKTMTLSYAAVEYTVTFNAGEGSVTPASAKTDANGKIALPIPTRDGYKFLGWAKTENGTTYVTADEVYTADATLYAQWTLDTDGIHTITFHNGETVVGTKTTAKTTGTKGSLASLLDAPAAPANYTFGGWYLADGTTEVTTSYEFEDDTNVYAKWVKKPTLTLSFNLNGGEGNTPANASSVDGVVTLPAAPTRSGYTFNGWYDAANGGNLVIAADATTYTFTGEADASKTLYAQWTQNQPAVVDYYLIGYINGANYGCEGDSNNMGTYKFVNGKLTVTFTADSYVFVKTTNNANWYMTDGYPGDTATSAVFYNTTANIQHDKLKVPANTEVEFTLTVNSANDTLTLSYEPTNAGGGATPPADPTYIVAGSAGLCGAEWAADNADNKMTKNGEVYTITYTDVAPGNYEFKVTDGTWTNSWPGSNYTFGVTATGDVTITFNPETKEITVTGDTLGEYVPDDDDDDEQGGGSVTPPPTTEMITVHAKVPTDWEAAYLYAWSASPYKTWPGAEMAKGSEGWWTVKIPANMENIIVTADSAGPQTVDKSITDFDGDVIWIILGEKNPDGYYLAEVTDTKPSSFKDEYAGNYVPPAAPTDFYLVGYINDADYYETTHKFVNGKLTITLTADSYAMIKDNNGDVYGTAAYCTEKTANMAIGGGEKMFVPKGEITFTLTVNADGTVKLSYTVPTPEGGNEGGEQGGNQSGTTGNPEVPTGSLIIHAKVPAAWASAYLYAWNTGDDVMASWPGTAMTKGDDGWYTIEIPAGYKNIIVAEKNGGEQTVDLSIANVTGNEIWVTLGEKNSDGKYPATIAEDEKGEEIVAPPEVKQITVYAKVPANWTTPYVYAWNGSGNNASWPGVAMTKGENGWWYAKVPATAENVIISNNGKTQTVDLKLEKLSVDAFVQVAAAGADGKYTATVQYSTNPDTGDTAIIAPVVFLMVMSVTGLAVLTVGKKKYF